MSVIDNVVDSNMHSLVSDLLLRKILINDWYIR